MSGASDAYLGIGMRIDCGCLGSTDPEHGQELHSCPGAIDHHAKVGNFEGCKLVSTPAVPKTPCIECVPDGHGQGS
jgi:hypothetical protein